MVTVKVAQCPGDKALLKSIGFTLQAMVNGCGKSLNGKLRFHQAVHQAHSDNYMKFIAFTPQGVVLKRF